MILVLDDLQWADAATLMLVRHLLRPPRPLPLLAVVSVREGDVGSVLEDLLVDLAADGRTSTVHLTGLTTSQVAVMTGDGGHAEDMHRLTAGNPLYVVELVRAGIDGGAVEDLPRRLVDVIERRTRRLTPDGHLLLTGGAISGLSFELATVAEALSLDLPRATAAADEAVDHGLIRPAPDEPLHRLEFVHPVVRQALIDTLTPARRGLLHHATGAAIEGRHGTDGPHAGGQATAFRSFVRSRRSAPSHRCSPAGRGPRG